MEKRVERQVRFIAIHVCVWFIVLAVLVGMVSIGLFFFNRSTPEMFLGLAFISAALFSLVECTLYEIRILSKFTWGSKKDEAVPLADTAGTAYGPTGVRDPGEPGVRGD